jgi:hypothetical protein
MGELVKIAIQILEALFFGGCAGSLLVVLLAGVEDMESVMERESPEQEQQ